MRYVAVVAVSKLLTLNGLLQQHIECLWGGLCFRSSSPPRVYADYYLVEVAESARAQFHF